MNVWQMGSCIEYKHVCQNVFRGSEDITYKCLNMDFNELFRLAQQDI